MKTTASLAAALLFVGFGATACGGSDGSGAPEDASKDEFCQSFLALDEDANVADTAEAFKKVGTPSDISDDARKGFEFIIDNAKKLDDLGDTGDDAAAVEKEFGKDAASQTIAFGQYVVSTCMGDMQDQMDDLPSDFPS